MLVEYIFVHMLVCMDACLYVGLVVVCLYVCLYEAAEAEGTQGEMPDRNRTRESKELSDRRRKLGVGFDFGFGVGLGAVCRDGKKDPIKQKGGKGGSMDFGFGRGA